MYAFYATRGYTLEYLSTLSLSERVFLRCAMEQYYREERDKFKALTRVGG